MVCWWLSPQPDTAVITQDYIYWGRQTQIISSHRKGHDGCRHITEWGQLVCWSGLSSVSHQVTSHPGLPRTEGFLGTWNVTVPTGKVLDKSG